MRANWSADEVVRSAEAPGQPLGAIALRAVRHLPIALVLFASITGGLLFAVQNLPVIYKSTAILTVAPVDPAAGAGEVIAPGDLPTLVDGEVEALNAPAMSDRILAELKRREQAGLSTMVTDAKTIRRSVSASRRNESNLIDVTAEAATPEDARILADGTVDAYLFVQLERLATEGPNARPTSSPEIEAARTSLATLESERTRLIAAPPIATRPNASLESKQLERTKADLAAIRKSAGHLNALLQSYAEPDGVVAFRASGALDQLGDRGATLAATIVAYEATSIGSPEAIAERENAKFRILTEASRLSTIVNADVTLRAGDLAALERSLAPAPVVSAGPELTQLESRIAEQRKMLAAALAAVGPPKPNGARLDGRVVSHAMPGVAPLLSQRMALSIAAIVVGLVVALAYAIGMAMASDTVLDLRDAAALACAPTVSMVPKITGRKLRRLPPGERHPANFALENPTSDFNDAMRHVLAVVRPNTSATAVCLVVAGGQVGAGATTIALGLGRMAAASGARVLLIDADLDDAGLTKAMGIKPAAGIEALLDGSRQLVDLVVEDDLTSVHLLPSAPDRGRGGALSLAQLNAFKVALSSARHAYDITIIDCQPHGARSRSRSLSRMADSALIVASYNVSKRVLLRAVSRRLLQNGAAIRGLVLNLAPERIERASASFVVRYDQDDPGFPPVAHGSGADVVVLRGVN